jgi:hypothetical protein
MRCRPAEGGPGHVVTASEGNRIGVRKEGRVVEPAGSGYLLRMRPIILGLTTLLLAACDTAIDLPPVAGPVAPLPTQQGAEVLSPVGPTTFTGTPGSSVIVQVLATRANGTPVNATPIRFEVQSGGGSVDPIVTTTAGEGTASAKWTFGSAAGLNLLKVSGGAAAAAPLSFTASTSVPD